MTLLADDGKPIFAEFAPPAPVPEAVTPVPEAVAPVQPTPNPVPPAAAAPPAADAVSTETIAEPPAPEPDELATEPLAPEPASIDWDTPDNPWRRQAEEAAQQAAQAQQELQRRQTWELQQAEEQSVRRQQDIMRRRMLLDANVDQYSPEDFKRASLELNRELAGELLAANQGKKALVENFGKQQALLQWDQMVAQAVASHALTPDEARYITQYATDDQHMEQLARDFAAKRETDQRLRSVTKELATIRAEQQKARSQAAAAARDSGADRSGGVGASPVPTPPPDSALGLLRQAFSGDPRRPISPG
jgi:hypothetical protein